MTLKKVPKLPPPSIFACRKYTTTGGAAIVTSPGGVFVKSPFDGCYSRATRDNFNHDQQVLTLVGLTETLGRGVSSRVCASSPDDTK